VLIVLSGLPGTGKSAIATRIAEVRGLPVLSVDPIESAIVRAGIAQSFETGLAAYVVAEALAESMLMTGLSPVIDAVNSVDEARDMWRGLAAKRGVTLRIIECSIADDDAHRARLHARERGLAIPEPAWTRSCAGVRHGCRGRSPTSRSTGSQTSRPTWPPFSPFWKGR